ncbi:ABC transporter ATP-binding protein [Sorangium sp. So ce204]|uniref:ABC transporter ATP-binding protein n=1 Tax=Sorangium sp. So ce204 TaxID=3133288 RepID=UPI003F61F642
MSAPALIEIEDAEVFRGDTRVFEGLSLRIEQGENTAILGPNGAGKSTLLRLLSREIYPVHRESSHVRILGRERWEVSALRRRLGLVSYELQMAYPRGVRGSDVVLSGFFASAGLHEHEPATDAQRRRVEEVLRDLGVAHLGEKPIAEMSAGEQRRCLLGRALVHDPEALVFDEPTTSLDLKAAFELIDLLRRLARQGKTLILVTHHVQEIPPEIGRVVLLRSGRVFADGPKRAVLTDDNLSRLFDVPLTVVERDGFFQVFPRSL